MKIVKKGFTLIELLIVIVVIGVLSAMMMLASTEVEASADVTRVINDMEAVKNAILMCITDNPDKFPNPPFCNPPSIDEVKKYLDNEEMINTDKSLTAKLGYWETHLQSNNQYKWFVEYKLPQYLTDSKSFRLKLASHAKKHMLFWSAEGDPIENAMQRGDCWYDGGTTSGRGNAGTDVFMLIMYRWK